MSTRQATPRGRGHGKPFTKGELDGILEMIRRGAAPGEIAQRYDRDWRSIQLKLEGMRETNTKPPVTRQCLGVVPHGVSGFRERCKAKVTSPGGVHWMCDECRRR